MKMMNRAKLVACVLIAAVTGACAGLSEEEAQSRCDEEKRAFNANFGCFPDETNDECVAAYEDCDDDVIIGDGCPPSYSCPE